MLLKVVIMANRPKTERNQKIWDFWQKGYRQIAIARMFKMKGNAVCMVIARIRAEKAQDDSGTASRS